MKVDSKRLHPLARSRCVAEDVLQYAVETRDNQAASSGTYKRPVSLLSSAFSIIFQALVQTPGTRYQEQSHPYSTLPTGILLRTNHVHIKDMNHSLPDLKKEPKPVGKTFAVKPEIKAFILNFMYHGVHAIEANLDQKEEKELAYAAAAQDFIKVKYGIEIKTVDIVKYYIEAQNAPRSAGFQKWNTSVIGTFIAHQIQHKNVYDDATSFEPVSPIALYFHPHLLMPRLRKEVPSLRRRRRY